MAKGKHVAARQTHADLNNGGGGSFGPTKGVPSCAMERDHGMMGMRGGSKASAPGMSSGKMMPGRRGMVMDKDMDKE